MHQPPIKTICSKETLTDSLSVHSMGLNNVCQSEICCFYIYAGNVTGEWREVL